MLTFPCNLDPLTPHFYNYSNNNEKFRSWVLGMGYVILLWHSLSLPYNYFKSKEKFIRKKLDHTAVSAIKASSVTL